MAPQNAAKRGKSLGYAALAVRAANLKKNPRALGKPAALPTSMNTPRSPNLRTGRESEEPPTAVRTSDAPPRRPLMRDPGFPARQGELQAQLKDEVSVLDSEIAQLGGDVADL